MRFKAAKILIVLTLRVRDQAEFEERLRRLEELTGTDPDDEGET